MKIHHLKLLNFRNYEKIEIDFSPKCNIIYGDNGSGKTNLVESIFVLALTKSFRGTVDKVLVMNNKSASSIEGEIVNSLKDKYRIVIKDSGKKVKINHTKIDKLSDYISKIRVVLFNPDDMRFIKDSPSVRRNAINLEISQLDNVYLKNLNMYNKLLKQRNVYLKTMSVNGNARSSYMEILTSKMIDVGEKIYIARKKYIDSMAEKVNRIYKNICEIDDLEMRYKSDYESFDKATLLEKYAQNLNKDIILGKTSIGVHHDDIRFKFKSLSLKDYASEGQLKNAIIAYKISEIELFYECLGDYPILILDDLFSELDKDKINNILNLISDDVQTFITTTDVDKINDSILQNSKLFYVCNGEIRED